MPLSPEGLTQLYNAPLSMTFQADALRQQLMQQGQLANDSQGIENLYKSQNNPLLVEQTRLENQSKQARIPGEAANSRSLGYKADLEGATQEGRIAAAQKKFLAEASDADISMLENKAQQMAYSQDPAMRAQGEQILRMHKDMVRDREKQAAQQTRQLELEKLRAANNERLANINNGAGRYQRAPAGGSGGGLADLESAVRSGKVGFEKAATAYASAAQEAMQAGDSQEAARLFSIANQYNSMYIQGRQAGAVAGQAGKVDLGAQSIPTVPLRAPQPFVPATPQEATPKPAAQKQTLQQVQQMYPGVPPEKLREAFKKKFGVDLQ